MNTYEMGRQLKKISEKDLLLLFADIDDIEVIEKISECAFHFIVKYENEFEMHTRKEKSEYQDAKELDDKQRYQDIKSVME